jgi:hypothetical protein
MRLSLAGVFIWFGVQQVYSPSDWSHYVPSFAADVSGVDPRVLIGIHGTLLLVAAAGLLSGVLLGVTSLLGVALLAQIVLGLAVENDDKNLIVRDLGLMGLALALVFDPTRVPWPSLQRLLRRDHHASRLENRKLQRPHARIEAR